MSLTSILSDSDDPVTRWFRTRLPRTAAVRASFAHDLPVRRVRNPVAAGRTVVRWDLLGHAIDYRIRAAFVAPAAPPAVVAGVQVAGAIGGRRLARLGTSLVAAYVELVRDEMPHRRHGTIVLEPAAEIRAAGLCFAMAWFERAYRDGLIAPGSPLGVLTNGADISWLLDRVPPYAVHDLQVQARLAATRLSALRDAVPASGCRSGPTFAGSAAVGGADADLLVGRTLLEIKSTSRPRFLGDEAIWQVAGYLLLDHEDVHAIDTVGFYLTRIGWLATWPAQQFLELLGARTSLSALREEFRQTTTRRLDTDERSTPQESKGSVA